MKSAQHWKTELASNYTGSFDDHVLRTIEAIQTDALASVRPTDREALEKMERRHGRHDADEVEHYETCECCQNFHRMEQEADALRKVLSEFVQHYEHCVGKICGERRVNPFYLDFSLIDSSATKAKEVLKSTASPEGKE